MEIFVPGSPDKTYTLVMDHRGTAYVLLDESASEVGRRYYDAFGVLISQTGSWPTDLAYQTNWQTIQIGNKWWGLSAARMYDFATGRFTQRDPLPSIIERAAYEEQNKLGIYFKTIFLNSINIGAMSRQSNIINYSKWFINTYRAWSSNAPNDVDPAGLASGLNAWPGNPNPYNLPGLPGYREPAPSASSSNNVETYVEIDIIDQNGTQETITIKEAKIAEIVQQLSYYPNIISMRVYAHGGPGGMQAGVNNSITLGVDEAVNSGLFSYVQEGGIIKLHVCEAGKGFAKGLADRLNRPIYAPTGRCTTFCEWQWFDVARGSYSVIPIPLKFSFEVHEPRMPTPEAQARGVAQQTMNRLRYPFGWAR